MPSPIKMNKRIILLNLFSLGVFAEILREIIYGGLIAKVDAWFNVTMTTLWNPFLNKIMIFITHLIEPINIIIYLALLSLMFAYKRKWNTVFFLVISIGGGNLIKSLLKILIQRIRPENALIEASSYSFPSGHATMSIIFFPIIIYLFKDRIKSKLLKLVFIITNMALILLVGFSRIYLNVHWFSDVIGGLALGLFWLTFLILLIKLFKININRTYVL